MNADTFTSTEDRLAQTGAPIESDGTASEWDAEYARIVELPSLHVILAGVAAAALLVFGAAVYVGMQP